MARTLELTLASILTLMGGVYVLRSSRAEQARHQAELAAAVARRASLSAALLEARAALEKERRWQGDERANLTRALQQRRRRRRIPPSPYQPKPFLPVATDYSLPERNAFGRQTMVWNESMPAWAARR